METVATSPAAAQPGWFQWLASELAPRPGRGAMALRIAITVMLVVVISDTLQVPELLLSAFMVLFVTKEKKVVTMLAGAIVILGATIAIAASLVIYRFTFDLPQLRIPVIAVVLFVAFFFSRTFKIGALVFGAGFILAATQSIAELVPSAEYLVHYLLWLWVAVCYPVALTVLINAVLPPIAGVTPAPERKPGKGLLVGDAWTNPGYVRFAFKVTIAAMACYIIYTGLDWAGIHTAFITSCFISLESIGATLHKAALRLVGCAVGGLIGFLSIIYLIPHMESIVSLVLLVGLVTMLAGWVAAGSERIAYSGLQIGLAFYMCILQSFEPDTDFVKIRDRIVGIVLGILVTTFVFRVFWPEPALQSNA